MIEPRLTFREIWERLQNHDESVLIEAKSASETGKSMWETISAFANEPGSGGGYLLLGVEKIEADLTDEYCIKGISDLDKIQRDLATQCREVFNIPIRPQIDIYTHDNRKNIVIAFIPEAQLQEKPIYIRSKGLPKGAFRRIGSTDQKCTDEDIALFYQQRSYLTYDETPIVEADIEDFDLSAIAEYRLRRAEVNPNAAELNYSGSDLLYALGATTKNKGEICPTLAGLILFGKSAALRRYFPMSRVDYIIVEGREWIPDPDRRYQTIEVIEPLLLSIPRLATIVLNDIPKAFTMGDNGIHRVEVPLIPRKVIREAITNALMHRNYRVNQPVQIIRFSNRIEIRNAGYSLKPIDTLGTPGSIARNKKIAAVLHEVGIADTKGTGIRVMIDEMHKANLTVPLVESNTENDSFTLNLLVHHLFSPEDIEWLARFKTFSLSDDEARALIVLREIGEINNFIYRSINCVDSLNASQRLGHLRNIGLLEQQSKGVATYYTLNDTRALDHNLASSSIDKDLSSEFDENKLASNEDRDRQKLNYLQQMPESLRLMVQELGQRSLPEEVKNVIVELCQWQNLSSSQLAVILQRNPVYLRKKYLNSLINSKKLEYIKKEISDPNQAYRATKN